MFAYCFSRNFDSDNYISLAFIGKLLYLFDWMGVKGFESFIRQKFGGQDIDIGAEFIRRGTAVFSELQPTNYLIMMIKSVFDHACRVSAPADCRRQRVGASPVRATRNAVLEWILLCAL